MGLSDRSQFSLGPTMRNAFARFCVVLSILIGFSQEVWAESSDPPNRPMVVQRLDQALQKLDLTADQRSRVDPLLEDLSRQLHRLKEQSSLDSLGQQTASLLQKTRDRLNEILTPEQSSRLDQLLPRRLRSSHADAGEKSSSSDSPSVEMSMMGTTPPSVSPRPASLPATQPATKPSLIPGMSVPVFTLNTLEKKSVSLTRYRGKPVVLIFGSFTSPTFRDKVPAFNALKKEFRNKVHFVVIYTREAYPNNEWEVQRNLNEQIRINQHTTLDERIQMARMTADGLKIDADVLVDDIDDGVAQTYDALPNGCVILDAQGKLFRRQKWANPHAVKIALNDVLKSRG